MASLSVKRSIINVAVDMKTENNEVMISGIITRRDHMDLHEKGMEVNERLKSLCSVYNFNFINNSLFRATSLIYAIIN